MSDALKQLLFRIDPTSKDYLVFLGDYIDRGPDSKGVIDTLLELSKFHQTVFIMGNHEEMAIAASEGKDEYAYWLKFGGMAAIQSYGFTSPLRPTAKFHLRSLPPEHLRFIATLVDYHETEKFVFVHAGCVGHLPMDKQSGSALRWETPEDGRWHCSRRVTVCGHSPRQRVTRIGGLWHVDTGAGVRPDGKLSAVDVLSGQVWSVPAPAPPR